MDDYWAFTEIPVLLANRADEPDERPGSTVRIRIDGDSCSRMEASRMVTMTQNVTAMPTDKGSSAHPNKPFTTSGR